RSGNQSASSCLIGHAIHCAAGHFSRRHIHLVYESAKIDIIHHALEEILILAACRRCSRKKKIVQSDRGGAERVGFDDVGTGFEGWGVNFLDDLRLGEKKRLEAAFEVFTFPVAKSLPSVVLLR